MLNPSHCFAITIPISVFGDNYPDLSERNAWPVNETPGLQVRLVYLIVVGWKSTSRYTVEKSGVKDTKLTRCGQKITF